MEEEHVSDGEENTSLLAHESNTNVAVSVSATPFWKDWRLYNVVMLGLAFMFLFTAFQTCSMVETLVLDGAHMESNGTFNGSGYTSLAIIYGVMGVSNWIAPSVVAVLTAKWSMVAGGVAYSLFIASFLKPMSSLLYAGSALVGVGAAVLWTAQGNCLTVNSDPGTMSRNTGIFWALFQSSILIGNIYVYINFNGVVEIERNTRQPMFIVLTVLAVIGTFWFALIRKLAPQQATESSSDSTNTPYGPWQAFKTSIRLFFKKEMLLLLFFFAYTGFELSFWAAVYGTSVGRTMQFGSMAKQLTGMCGIFIGIGEILGAIALGLMSRLKFLGRDLIVLIGYVIHITCFFLIFLNLPAQSPLQATDDMSYITPNKYLAIVCAFMLGLGDSLFQNQTYGIIGALFPDESAPAFALFKFIQSLACALAFVYSQVLELHWQLLVLVVVGTIGSILFFFVDVWARQRVSERDPLINSEVNDERSDKRE